MNKYLIIVEETKTGYSAYAPDVDGCIATGHTRHEVKTNMKEALVFHLDGMREEGRRAPAPHAQPLFCEV